MQSYLPLPKFPISSSIVCSLNRKCKWISWTKVQQFLGRVINRARQKERLGTDIANQIALMFNKTEKSPNSFSCSVFLMESCNTFGNDVGTRPVPGPVRPVTGRGTQLPSEILQVHEFTSNTKPAHPMSPCQ